MKCVVSGATGFIGRQLCRHLLGQGESLIGLSKSGAALPDGTSTLAVDLSARTPDAKLLESLQGIDVVFHLAGIAHQRARDSAYEELNYLGTLRLARLAAEAGARRFVFLSSVKAMGPSRVASERSEQDCVEPVDAYGLSKWRAENALREEFGSAAMAVIILRPALVYGPGARGNLRLLARAVRAGLPRPPAAGARSMIALEDLVELLYVVGRSPVTGVHTWIACDGRSYTTRFLFDQLRAAAGKGPGLAWLPGWGWRLAAAALDLLAGRGGESSYAKLFGTELYSNARVLAETDWRPRVTLEDVIPDLAAAAGIARR